jgi:hypothetical protein
MFLVDNLLLGPGKAAMFVFKELARKAQEDWLDDDAIKQELQEIYALVEAGKISTQDFEARECRLLERLEQIAKAKFKDKWGQQQTPAVIDTVPLIEDAPSLEPVPAIERITTITALPLEPPPPPLLPPPVLPPPQPLPPPPPPAPPRAVAATPVPAPPVMTPPVPAQPVMTPPVMTPPVMTVPPAGLSIVQVMESTSRALSLLNLKVSAITSVSPADDGWRITAELIERRGVPDTNDQIGVYELRLDGAGNVTRYERTRLRRRGDLGR